MSSRDCMRISAPLWASTGCREDSLSSPWSPTQAVGGSLCRLKTSSPHYCTDLAACKSVPLTCFQSSLLWLQLVSAQCFFLLNFAITEVLALSVVGSDLAGGRSILELARGGPVRLGGSFWQLLLVADPVAPLFSQPCHTNPLQTCQLGKVS